MFIGRDSHKNILLEKVKMIKKSNKKVVIKITLALLSQLFFTLAMHADQSDQASAARGVIAGLIKSTNNVQDQITALSHQDKKVSAISRDIDQLTAQISTLKGASAWQDIQNKLQQVAIAIWANSIDPLSSTNLNRSINKTLNDIFLYDPIINEQLGRVSQLKREINERISQQGWPLAIQKLGRSIEALAANEIKQTLQNLAAVQTTQAQLITAQGANASLAAIEMQLAKKELLLKAELAKGSADTQQRLIKYKLELRKMHFMLEIMQNPSKASNIKSESITTLDISSDDLII